jgi:hypothetical protein
MTSSSEQDGRRLPAAFVGRERELSELNIIFPKSPVRLGDPSRKGILPPSANHLFRAAGVQVARLDLP